MRKFICLIAYEGMELLDFAAPQSAFYEALQGMDDSYEFRVVGFRAFHRLARAYKLCFSVTLIAYRKAFCQNTDDAVYR
ncbi:hypothetical protein [Alteromonas macleodii]|uniref:hypothetical protein n=1 Tax=Alteromonas macleodii TaxID=28108 RepID=UPI0015D14BCA|nr:hypothetical protein [Alteromonas macleodii]